MRFGLSLIAKFSFEMLSQTKESACSKRTFLGKRYTLQMAFGGSIHTHIYFLKNVLHFGVIEQSKLG